MNSRPLVIVDDSDEDLFFARRAHRLTGVSAPLVCLESGQQMLAHYQGVLAGQAPAPAAILLDINMPQLDGFATFAKLLASAGEHALSPVWFLTGSDDPDDRRAARELGARGLLTKPDSVRELASLLQEVWGLVGGTDAEERPS